MAKATQFIRDPKGALNLNSALVIIAVVIGALVGLQVLAALLPSYFTSVQSVVGTLNTATVGNTSANSLMPTFSLLAAFAAIFAIVGLVLLVVKFRKS